MLAMLHAHQIIMATNTSIKISSSVSHPAYEEDTNATNQKHLDLVSVLPRERGWISEHIHKYQGFWYSTSVLKGLLILQQHFQATPTDILLASFPKSGTTWLKALLFTITNRTLMGGGHLSNPLVNANPHELVPYLETYACMNPKNPTPASSLMNTHISYSSLPKTITESGCRIIYVIRDPKDVLVSCWHFLNKLRPKGLPPLSLKDAFEQFSQGSSPYGPYWDHVEGYIKASLESPDKVFVLRYEDLKKEPIFYAKRLAEFIGHGFSLEEEKQGMVNKVVDFCSFENLSSLEVNKSGKHCGVALSTIENNIFFRQGKVGDAKNHLSKEMMDVLDGISERRFKNFNLDPSFCVSFGETSDYPMVINGKSPIAPRA